MNRVSILRRIAAVLMLGAASWVVLDLRGEPPRTDDYGDRLPEGALLRLGTIRHRAPAGINHAALSPDGKLLATASEAGLTLFDLATGKPRHLRESGVANGFNEAGSLVAFSPDGKALFNVNEWGGLCCWEVSSGKLIRQLGNPGQAVRRRGGFPAPAPANIDSHWDRVWYPQESTSVVVSTPNGVVMILDPSSGETRERFSVKEELASVSPSGTMLAAIDTKRSEVVLHDEKGKELRRVAPAGQLKLAALIDKGKRLATANAESEIRVWDAATGKEERTIQGPVSKHEKPYLTLLAATPDGKTLFAGTKKGEIHSWDLATGKEQEPLRGHLYWVTGLFFPPGGRTLVSVSWDHLFHRWDLASGKAIPSSEGYASSIQVARSPDGRSIALGSGSGRLELWDAGSGKLVRTLRDSGPYFSQLRYSPDGKFLAVGQSDFTAVLWDVGKGTEVRRLQLPPSEGRPGSWFDGLAFSPDGRFLATSADPDRTRLWEVASGKEVWQAPQHGAAGFAPDGKTLVTSNWDQPLQFRDVATGDVRFPSAEKMRLINHLSFSPDGSLLATCHHDGNVYLRDASTGERVKTLKGHSGVVWSVSFSPDGKWLASSGDETVRVWEVASGAEVLCREGHESRAYRAEFGPDARTILSSSMDLTALLWSAKPPSEPGPKPTPEALWNDLAADSAKAYRATWALLDNPKASCTLLWGKIPPVKLDVDEKRVRKLIADLGDEDFATREAATRALSEMGTAVDGFLRKALKETDSTEARKRLEKLLDGLKKEPSPDDLRRARAVQVLELANTIEARRVLQDWAGGTADVPLTKDALAALKRLERHPTSPGQ
jgi:WD40 repeat protein